MTAKKLVAITGITGFIGRTLAARLAASGWQVRGLARPGRQAGGPFQVVRGSLENFFSLRELVQGADAVVHCAGAVRGASEDDFDRVNVAGLERLLRAVRAHARSAKLLCLSSLAARRPELSFYAASKKKGEEALAAAGAGLSWVIIRPPAVYGPGDREMLPVFRLLHRGIAPLPDGGRGRFSLLHVDDLAAAVLRLLELPVTGRVFELHDGKPGGYDWFEVVELVAAFRQKPIRRLQVPFPLSLLLPFAWGNQLVGRVTGWRPMLTPGKLRELACPDWVCDNEGIGRETGWQPTIDLAAGLATLFPRA